VIPLVPCYFQRHFPLSLPPSHKRTLSGFKFSLQYITPSLSNLRVLKRLLAG